MGHRDDNLHCDSDKSCESKDDIIIGDELYSQLRDQITVSMEKILEIEHESISSKCCIYKIPKNLRDTNPDAYTPQVVSIGPLHHGQKGLMPMEACKRMFLQCFFNIRIKNLMSTKKIVEEVMTWEKRVRSFYIDPIEMSSAKFVELILVDGCFIVEFLLARKYGYPPSIQNTKYFYLLNNINVFPISGDLIKLENQLPFFVLQNFYDIYKSSNPKENASFFQLVYDHLDFSNFIVKNNHLQPHLVQTHGRWEVAHFVEFLWHYFKNPHSNSSNQLIAAEEDGVDQRPPIGIGTRILDYICYMCRCSMKMLSKQEQQQPQQTRRNVEERVEYVQLCCPNATQLDSAGVTFKKVEGNCFIDIITSTRFRNGVLEIPPIEIFYGTETYLRNLIAFEQGYGDKYSDGIITQFVLFIDYLINTEKDVSLLIEKGIISNALGHTEAVSKLFNNLGKQLMISRKTLLDSEYEKINKYMGEPCHRWMASLRRDYFNTPWAFISFVGAIILLLLTLIQTIFSFISVKK